MQSGKPNPIPSHSATDVYVRSRGVTVRVNPPGTYAETGGIDGNRLVLQVVRPGRSNLALFDLTRRRLAYLPSSVNDGAWLWRPDVDGNRVLYGAVVPGESSMLRYEIRLADLGNGRVRTLARLDGHAAYAAPGQLSGRWATWVSCPDNVCNVQREDLVTGRVDAPPDTEHLSHWQLGPAVDANGVVYFSRGLSGCGEAQLRRWDGRRTTTLVRLPPNYGLQYSYLDKSTRRLYFDLVGCDRAARSDIYRTQRAMP
ncbi:MAG TPA: hypothetical protein VGO31_03095 [Microbacteriaceae bacterium]|nr:hypothetical protein [Microbacteriaceae bacterium]